MIKENSSNHDQQNNGKPAEVVAESITQTSASPLAPSVQERYSQEHGSSQVASNAAQENETNAAQEGEKPVTNFERKVAIVGIGLAAITAALFYVQLREMTNQTEILASQSESAAAGAANGELNTRQQLRIAQQQADAASQSGIALHRQVTEIRRQTRIAERPWLSVDAIRLVTLEANKPAYVEMDILNTGKTVTQKGMSQGSIYVPDQEMTTFEHYKHYPPGHIAAIFPSPAHPGIVPFLTDRPLTETEAKQVAEGTRFLYVWTEISYSDAFGPDRYHLCVCGRYVPTTHRFESCKHYKECAN